MFGLRIPGTCVTLYYHAVSKEEVSRFARQMDLLKRLACSVPADDMDRLTEGIHHAAVTFDDGFQSVHENALPVLRERQIPATVFVTAGYVGSRPGWPDDPWDPNPTEALMTDAQINALPYEWVTIGSHTLTHQDLGTLDELGLKKELFDSKRELEAITGRPVTLLSLPYGLYSQRALRLASEAGYKCTFGSTLLDARHQRTAGIVGRIRANPSDWAVEFKLKVMGAYCWVHWAGTVKKEIRGIFQEK
jgi:peptidoglycan/xylan/chitin deacetylase (PgdA/CDA1 family)